jgi:hypothetical protein
MLAKLPADRPATPGAVAEALGPFAASADPAALLVRAEGTAPRAVPPSTSTASLGHTVRAAWGRYALAAAAGAALALLAAVPFLGPRREQNSGANAGQPPDSSAAEPEGVRLTYGPHGPPRPDNRVLPGEEVFLDYVIGRVGKDAAGDVDVSTSGELVDQSGKKWAELAPAPRKGPLYLGGSTFEGWVSFSLAADQKPGEYKARARTLDNVTGRGVNFEHPVYVLKPEFGAVRLRLTHDRDGALPAGSHFTLGQSFFVQGRVVSYVRRDGRVDVAISVAARDGDGKDTAAVPLKPLRFAREVEESFTYFDFSFGPLQTIMAGEVVIVVEMRDAIGDRTATYQLPAVIHPPRSIRPTRKQS